MVGVHWNVEVSLKEILDTDTAILTGTIMSVHSCNFFETYSDESRWLVSEEGHCKYETSLTMILTTLV